MIEQNVSPDRADRDAQAPMVMAGDRRRSQADIRIRADRAAEGLKRSGVGEGDAVALLLRNDIAFFEASLAAARAGASPVPVNWHAAPAETAYILSDCGAKVLIGHEDLLGPVLPHLPPGVLVLAVETPKEIRAAFGLPPPIPAPREAAGTTVVPPLGRMARTASADRGTGRGPALRHHLYVGHDGPAQRRPPVPPPRRPRPTVRRR